MKKFATFKKYINIGKIHLLKIRFYSIFLNNFIFLFINNNIKLNFSKFKHININMFKLLSLFINENIFCNFLKINSIILYFIDFSFLKNFDKKLLLNCFSLCIRGFFVNIKYIFNIQIFYNIFNNNYFFFDIFILKLYIIHTFYIFLIKKYGFQKLDKKTLC